MGVARKWCKRCGSWEHRFCLPPVIEKAVPAPVLEVAPGAVERRVVRVRKKRDNTPRFWDGRVRRGTHYFSNFLGQALVRLECGHPKMMTSHMPPRSRVITSDIYWVCYECTHDMDGNKLEN